jgi:hypothetical protein
MRYSRSSNLWSKPLILKSSYHLSNYMFMCHPLLTSPLTLCRDTLYVQLREGSNCSSHSLKKTKTRRSWWATILFICSTLLFKFIAAIYIFVERDDSKHYYAITYHSIYNYYLTNPLSSFFIGVFLLLQFRQVPLRTIELYRYWSYGHTWQTKATEANYNFLSIL